MHLQVRIIDSERTVSRETACAVDGFQPLLDQSLVVVNTRPPTFAVKGVGDIELRSRVAVGRIGSLPFVTRGSKLLTSEKRESTIERLPG